MRNFLKETLERLADSGKTVEDVDWVGSRDGKYAIGWSEFEVIADFEYDSGYGGQEIAADLVIVFSDGSLLYRGEYDGSEWWEYMKTPQKADEPKTFDRARGNRSWMSIDELSREDDKE